MSVVTPTLEHMTANRGAWVRPRPERASLRTDAVIALLLALASLTTALLYQRTGIYADRVAPAWVWAVGIGMCSLPLAWRRRYPVPVACIVALGFFICGQFAVPDLLIINICLFTALYSVSAWEQRRSLAVAAQVTIACALIAWLVLMLIVSASDTDAYPGLSRSGLFSAFATFAVIQIITNLLYFGGAFYFGERAWRAARAQALLAAQGRELERERQTSAAQAVALDRLEIARELHDVVAHHVSVMGIQAAAARRSLTRDPALATASLELVEQSAHAAVTELRQLVHTLRTPEADETSATVGIAQFPALIAESQSAGVPTALIVAGDARPLPMLIDVALYRVVQESLTNVRKHAGRGAAAEVRLRFSGDAVEVEISDDGVLQRLVTSGTGSTATPDLRGLGIRGMRERIGAVGGTVTAGRRERGGFLVRATVPHASAAQQGDILSQDSPASPPAPSAQLPPGHARFTEQSPSATAGTAIRSAEANGETSAETPAETSAEGERG